MAAPKESVPRDFADLLGKFGIDRKSLMKIRFGGVIGKLALVGIGGLGGLTVVAVKADGLLLWACLIAMLVLALSVVSLIAFHGHKHPLEATLEGGEIVVMQHLRHEAAAKGMDQVPALPPVLEGLGKKKELTESKES